MLLKFNAYNSDKIHFYFKTRVEVNNVDEKIEIKHLKSKSERDIFIHLYAGHK